MGRPAGHYKVASKNDLTHRQREVLDLIVRGKTNGEIADELGITLDGAKWHVSEILARLGVDSREEAAEWYREQRRRRLLRPALRGLLPGWLVKAGAGAGAAAVAGVGVVAMFTGGEEDAEVGEASAGDADICMPSDLVVESRQYPYVDGSLVLETTFHPRVECHLYGRTVTSLFRAGQTLESADVEGDRLTIQIDERLSVGEAHTVASRWSNWCDPHTELSYDQRYFADRYPEFVYGGGYGDSVVAVPQCTDQSSSSFLETWDRARATDQGNGGPSRYCGPGDILQARLETGAGPDGAQLYRFGIWTARDCELNGTLWGGVGRDRGQIWDLGVRNGVPELNVAVPGESSQTIAYGRWTNWCWPDAEYFATVGLDLPEATMRLQVSGAFEGVPPCLSELQNSTLEIMRSMDWSTGSRVLECTPSPGCAYVADHFVPGSPRRLAQLVVGPGDRFRVMGPGQSFPVTIKRAEFESIVQPLLAGFNNSLLAIGCSDKGGPGTCVAMDLVLQTRNGGAFGLAFDNSSGTPVLFGVTPEVDTANLDDRREAIFGSAEYVVFDPPFPLFIE